MTIAFWVLAANLTLIALLIVIVPIWLRRDVDLQDNQQLNLSIGRQKLAELKDLRAQDKLTVTEYEEQLTELEMALEDELNSSGQSAVQPQQGRWILAVIIPVLPLAAFGLYGSLGAPQLIDLPNPQATAQAAVQPESMDINAMLAKLVDRLAQNPDDVDGWLMLGRTHMFMQNYDKAVEAFAKADQLQPQQTEIMIQYADALAMRNGGSMAGIPSEMVFAVLQQQPQHTTALWLAGMAKAEFGDHRAALDYWRQLAPNIADDAQASAQLQKLIADAQAKIGVSGSATDATTSEPEAPAHPVATPKAMLSVQVSLAESLQTQVAANDTVFIYALALEGMRMPLAIVRKQVRDLPLTVTLSDIQAMSPMAKLSDHEQVQVLARVSKAGSAISQPGDLIGSVDPVVIERSEPIQIIINERLK